ncbi:hypothetical protein [Streptomyces sp. NPDC001985]|uniref:hypothetical protein n=1 Tax=Streptomyces sp. NPDC001985 TaxID=3154406 RepID=UPI003324E53C
MSRIVYPAYALLPLSASTAYQQVMAVFRASAGSCAAPAGHTGARYDSAWG